MLLLHTYLGLVSNLEPENFVRDFKGTWGSKYSFAANHFQNKFVIGKDVEPFINYNAYSDSIFKTDFHAVELADRTYIFKKE